MISFRGLGQQGRLGNQMFQMAATMALALRHNDQYVFPSWEYEKDFNLHGCFSNPININETYQEPHFHYAPISYKPNLDLTGYFQSQRYFEDHQDIIRQLLTPKAGFGIQWGHTGVHVRRGDYVRQTRNYAQIDMNYYRRAMDMIGSQHYIVFSDDVSWCKANFRGNNIQFSEGRSVAEDLSLLSACEHQIIANSSFSWWGAWLNANPSKTVIAPAQWFGPGLAYNDTRDLLPPTWTRV